jgi:N-acetylglucosaminyl-diphospho-decaprenol L-rhamnosyltransferase
MPELSIVVVNWNTRQLLAECLASLYQHPPACSFDIWVVDNASTDGSVEMLRQRYPEVHLIANAENLGFARANNQAMAQSAGRYVLLFNSDAAATPEALEALVGLAQAQPRAAIVGARLLNPDGSFQAAYTAFPTLWREFLILTGLGRLVHGRWYPSAGPESSPAPREVDYVEGACLLVARQAILAVGRMDEGYFMYAEEVDWCMAMKRAGWQVWYQPRAEVIHHGGASSRRRRPQREADLYRSRVRFFRKWYGAGAARGLKALIFGATALKAASGGWMWRLSGGRYGRPVVSLGYLARALREV